MTDALGESQVLSYLIGLAKSHKITLVSFEKKEAFISRGKRIEELCKEAKIKWYKINYTSKPPILSTIYDLFKLNRAVNNITDYNIVHCRGYITSLIGLNIKIKKNIPFIFDMRGFWADEKLESGHWGGILFKPIYNYFKSKEKRFLETAAAIISLTENGKSYIVDEFKISKNKIHTIPTCVNLEVFKPYDNVKRNKIRQKLGLGIDEKILIYSGSVGGSYNPKIIIEAYREFKKYYSKTKLLILTKTIESDKVIFNEFAEDVLIFSVDYSEVWEYLITADLGLIFYTPGFSNIGRYPTKLAEYWACGLPLIIFNNVGDTNELLEKNPKYGFNYNNTVELKNKLSKFNLNVDKVELRIFCEQKFSLENGIKFYNKIYKTLVNEK